MAYDNTERLHRGLTLEPPLAASRRPVPTDPISSRPVLAGRHLVYTRAA
jgi:hypothetical protein